MARTEQPVVYAAESGKRFVYLSDFPIRNELLYSPDGETYYVLVCSGFGGTTIEHDLSFDDPHQGIHGKLRHEGDVVTYNGERFVRQDGTLALLEAKIIPLPFARATQYLCQTEDGTFIYVSADKYDFTYGSFRLFIGDGTTMREVPIRDVQRYRDGGTTYIETAEETFFSPAPINRRYDNTLVSKWGKQSLVDLDDNGYQITETPDGRVTISKK